MGLMGEIFVSALIGLICPIGPIFPIYALSDFN